jgi:hypothetical protein
MRRAFYLFLLGAAVFIAAPAPEAKAVDPITIALLAPVAMKAFEKASPYILKGLTNTGKGFVLMGTDVIDIFRLPLGFFQTTFLMPFGYFKDGVYNIAMGAIAPFKLCFHTVTLPLMMCGFTGGG